VYDRFGLIPGADQAALDRAHVVLVGAGGLGGEVGHGLVRKGVGHLTCLDPDLVEISNLARQFFSAEDLGQNKALALVKNLARQATGDTLLEGQASSFQKARERPDRVDGTLAVVGVDNNSTRFDAARYYLARRIPVVFLAVDATASKGYVFVQTSQPGHACLGCLFPDGEEDRRVYGCTGASIEILKIVAGIALYAVDSLLMARPRTWNYKEVFLDQAPDGHRTILPRSGCLVCGDR
jgi:molybdopterin/thiamine biosynthesis adenylyltransferase